MCTAITLKTEDFYFGRTLDMEYTYCEEVTVTPRNYEFSFKNGKKINNHFAIIGMAYVLEDYPLYYDAVNEKGLCIAGLNFPDNAYFGEAVNGKDNVATYEFIPWLLSQCESVKCVREKLQNINITNQAFNDSLPPATLHWIVSDKSDCITVESTKDGLFVYDNPVGVMTNNPIFPMHMQNLNNYMHLSPKEPENNFSNKLSLHNFCKGLGAVGLPGDLSSPSRFVRASFVKSNSVSGDSEFESVGQFFHIIGTVEQVRGACELGDELYEITVYTSCCNADKGVYYYTTYNNHQITAVDMHKCNLQSAELYRYPLVTTEQIAFSN